jgi:hypothetical protein
MMKRLVALFLLFAVSAPAQNLTREYQRHVKKADSLFMQKDYKGAGLAYSAAFKSMGWKGTVSDRLGAARAWARADMPDSAFTQLFRLAEKTFYKDADRLVKDESFKSLVNDKRWDRLLTLVKENASFNLGFERVKDGMLPDGWFQWGTKDYLLRVDSVIKHSGKYAVLIEPFEGTEKKSFGSVAYQVENVVNNKEKYAGKEIEVRAFIKMQDNDEPVGLLIRLDGNDAQKSLGFDNMMHKGIKGTRDWEQYRVKIPFPAGVKAIYIGVINSGSGKVWCDDFEVLVDGKPLEQ